MARLLSYPDPGVLIIIDRKVMNSPGRDAAACGVPRHPRKDVVLASSAVGKLRTLALRQENHSSCMQSRVRMAKLTKTCSEIAAERHQQRMSLFQAGGVDHELDGPA